MVSPKNAAEAPQLLALRSVARELQVSEEYAIGVYERELRGLRREARFDRFVAVLAEKRAKHALRSMKG